MSGIVLDSPPDRNAQVLLHLDKHTRFDIEARTLNSSGTGGVFGTSIDKQIGDK